MADEEDNAVKEVPEVDTSTRKQEMEADLNDPITLAERVYQIWWHWADFHIYVVTPPMDIISPPVIIKPETIPGTDDLEFVYPIYDGGSKLSTSKSEEMFSAGMSMSKLYLTIEKMIYLLVERLKAGGVGIEDEVKVSFAGHLLAQRKAFESIINLNYNLVVTNFDPGPWGERYLQIVKKNAEKFGYPPEAPRESFRQSYKASHSKTK